MKKFFTLLLLLFLVASSLVYSGTTLAPEAERSSSWLTELISK